MNRGEDRDDWFSGIESDERRAPFGGVDEDAHEDWLQEIPPAPGPRLALDRRVVLVAVFGVGLLIAVLAAAGVFSSSPHRPAPPVTTTGTISSTTATTTPTRTPLPAPTVPLKPGDTGAQVKVLQRALVSLGFLTGKADGDYGPATEAAVKRFQTSVHIKADGIVGPATRRALATALAGA